MTNRLREIRAAKRVTQFELRLSTGIHQSKISLIENGLIDPTAEEKEKIACALEMKPGKIWRNNGESAQG
jgi:transcriptional regulator with XRE-family HTH domain